MGNTKMQDNASSRLSGHFPGASDFGTHLARPSDHETSLASDLTAFLPGS